MGLNLITRSEFKAYKGIISTNFDSQIDSLIVKVSQFIKTYCKRTFLDFVDDYKVEVFRGGPFLLPKEYPILSVDTLEYSTDYGTTYTALVENVEFAVDYENHEVLPTTAEVFPEKINGYKLTYKAGFEELPEDLKLAAMDLVDYYMKNDSAVHSTKAPGTNNVQIEYITTTGLPAHIRRVLDMYMAHYA